MDKAPDNFAAMTWIANLLQRKDALCQCQAV